MPQSLQERRLCNLIGNRSRSRISRRLFLAPRPDLALDMLWSGEALAFVQDLDRAEALYAAMCNRAWRKEGTAEGAPGWNVSWRVAGGIVAKMRDLGELYVDFYCSGNEGFVRQDVETLLTGLGWAPVPDDPENGANFQGMA
jgi:hypothetical protein